MFFALGVGAWNESVFHLMTHALFKALLFMTAGSIILAMHHEQDIRSMGGLRRQLPVPFWCFVIGSACLVALPPTSGFFSKEAILIASWQLPGYGPWLWLGGVLGAFITAMYSFRLLFMVFFGPQKAHPHEPKGWQFHPPLMILGALSLVAGWFVLPTATVLPASPAGHPPTWTIVVAIAMPLLGIGIAYKVYVRHQWQGLRFVQWQKLRQFLFQGWGFDGMYKRLLLTPFTTLAQVNRNDMIDGLPKLLIQLSRFLHGLFSQLQNGQLRFYIATLASAAIIVLALALKVL